MKKQQVLFLSFFTAMVLGLSACSKTAVPSSAPHAQQAEKPVDLVVFAAASMTDTLEEIAMQYQKVAPHVTLIYNFASSGDLQKQIEEGAECDLFISASPKQMNALDGSLIGDAQKNPGGLDLIYANSRVDFLENKVVLAVPKGNPKGLESFDQLAQLLKNGKIFLAVGNSDVPAGQYAQKIFTYYGLDEAQLARSGVLTYGSNVKEVTTQVCEAAVDGGIIYATDAFSAGLTSVASATAQQCGQVIYPAAVLKNSLNTVEAQKFLDYLSGADASFVFSQVGFSPLG